MPVLSTNASCEQGTNLGERDLHPHHPSLTPPCRFPLRSGLLQPQDRQPHAHQRRRQRHHQRHLVRRKHYSTGATWSFNWRRRQRRKARSEIAKTRVPQNGQKTKNWNMIEFRSGLLGMVRLRSYLVSLLQHSTSGFSAPSVAMSFEMEPLGFHTAFLLYMGVYSDNLDIFNNSLEVVQHLRDLNVHIAVHLPNNATILPALVGVAFRAFLSSLAEY